MRRLFNCVGGLLIIILITGVVLFVGTRGDYPVMALVTDDPDLPSITIDSVQIHYRIVEGPPNAEIVFVPHGRPGGDFRSLQGLDALSSEYRVIYYDQRGAGLSERVSTNDLSVEAYIRELHYMIDTFSPGTKPILIGHSWGATLTSAFVGVQPERVSRAILIEPVYLDAAGRMRWQSVSVTTCHQDCPI